MSSPRAIVFGKLPRHGDFVARGLSEDRKAAWDAYFAIALETARVRLGDDFAATHEAASPWLFVSGPGRFGDDWRAGVMAASVDAVGRRFFIAVAIDGLNERQAAADGNRLSRAVEDLLHRAFTLGWSVDILLEAADRLIDQAEVHFGASTAAAKEQWSIVASSKGRIVSLSHPPIDPIGEAALAFASEGAK